MGIGYSNDSGLSVRTIPLSEARMLRTFSMVNSCSNSIFTDSNLTKSIFKNTKIKDTNFTHSNLKGANFSSAKLFNVNLRDAVYDKDTLWPQKFNPSNFGAIEDNNYNPFDYKTKLSYQASAAQLE